MAIMQGHQSWVLDLSADGRLLGSTYVNLHLCAASCFPSLALPSSPTVGQLSDTVPFNPFVTPEPKLIHRGADKNVKLWDIAQRSAVYTTALAAPAWAFDWQPADVQIGSLGPSKQFAVGGDEKAVLLYRQAGSI